MSSNLVSGPDTDRLSAELIIASVRFLQLFVRVPSEPLMDGQPTTAEVIREAVEIDGLLDLWERRQTDIQPVTEERADDLFPPEAVFEGCYHVYTAMYMARSWNHYRRTRIMVSQMLV